MKAFDPDQFRALNAAVLSDVMDALGLMNQAMQPFVRPLDENLVLAGRARTGLYMLAYEVREGENPYEVEIALVDDLQPGDVPVECAGVKVRDGDSVFGDVDGVVVIPRERAAEVLAKANEKVAGEGRTRDELRQGRLLREVFEKYRIL